MRSDFLLIAAGLASTAIATSYNYARDLDADYAELQERDAPSYEQDVTHILRSLDDDELNDLYARGVLTKFKPKTAFKKGGAKLKGAAHKVKSKLGLGKNRRRNVFSDFRKNWQLKPGALKKLKNQKPSGPVGYKKNSLMNKILRKSRFGPKLTPKKKKKDAPKKKKGRK